MRSENKSLQYKPKELIKLMGVMRYLKHVTLSFVNHRLFLYVSIVAAFQSLLEILFIEIDSS